MENVKPAATPLNHSVIQSSFLASLNLQNNDLVRQRVKGTNERSEATVLGFGQRSKSAVQLLPAQAGGLLVDQQAMQYKKYQDENRHSTATQ